MRLSVCTHDAGRRDHLANLILGLRRSPRPPHELVIAVRGDELRHLPPASFPIRQVVLRDDAISPAAARNAAAARATGDLLVFLHPDCIAHPEMLADYAAGGNRRGIVMGEVRFLPPGAAAGGIDFARFDSLGVSDAGQGAPPEAPIEPCRDFRAFRALNFAIGPGDFRVAGGFDARYAGEGGEDIDFSRAAMSAGLPFARLRSALAYHQHSRQLVPPVDRIDEILANANLFASKWDQPVMADWLRAFELMGLAEEGEDGWRKLREPGARDLALAEAQADEPVTSGAAAVAALEQRAAGGRTGPLRPAA